MRKPLAQVPLETGNRIAWIAVAVFVAFCGGWIAHAVMKPLVCLIVV